MSNNDAQARALAIPEIVIAILHQLDMQTLITAQRISRTWKDLICTTRSLQETLFLQPISKNLNVSAQVENPLLAAEFPSIFNIEIDICLTDLDWAVNPAVREMFIRPEASWRRMLTHQPPLYRVGAFSFSTTPFKWRWRKQRAVIPEDGLRMGPLFEFLIDRHEGDWAYGHSIGAFFPASLPGGLLRPSRFKRWDEAEQSFQRMNGQFDLVFEIRSSTTCTSEQDYEDGVEEMEKGARERGEVLPDSDLTVWKRIRECYRELGLKMDGFKMEMFEKVSGMWD